MISMKKGISFVVPVYNTPFDKVERCIASIDAVKSDSVEIILVDDGSIQECAAAIDQLAAQYENTVVIHKKNEGSAIARNTGAANAHFEYLTFVDSDDFITGSFVKQALDVIENYSPDLIIGLVKQYSEFDESAMKVASVASPGIKIIDEIDDRNKLVNHMLGKRDQSLVFDLGYIGDGPVARVCKKELFAEATFTKEPYPSDDTIWNLIYVSKAKEIVIVEDLWYAYLINNASKTRKYRENGLYEKKYRVTQMCDLVRELWPNCYQGLYIKIWHETYQLGVVYLFHKSNKSTSMGKYHAFKEFIETSEYQEMLRNISFSDRQFLKRTMKRLICFLCTHDLCYFAFLFWKKYASPTRLVKG